jgi:hypothetical protein
MKPGCCMMQADWKDVPIRKVLRDVPQVLEVLAKTNS